MTTIPEESHNETTPFTEEQCHFLERAIATVVANTTIHPQMPLSPPILSNANLPKPPNQTTSPLEETQMLNCGCSNWNNIYDSQISQGKDMWSMHAALFRGSAISVVENTTTRESIAPSQLGGIQRHHAENFLPH